MTCARSQRGRRRRRCRHTSASRSPPDSAIVEHLQLSLLSSGDANGIDMNEQPKRIALFVAIAAARRVRRQQRDRLAVPDFSRAITVQRLQNAASEPHNWLTHGGTYLEQRHSPLTEINKDTLEQARARLVLRVRYVSRAGSDTARRRRRAVHDDRLEQGLCAERGDRRADLELRPEGARRRRRESLLRRELARPGALHEQAHHRDARRPAHRARPRHGRAGLEHGHRRSDEDVHDHGRAARREGQGHHRQRRRRVRRARLRQRLRRRYRRARVALLRRARRSGGRPRRRGVRQSDGGDRGADVVRPLVRDGRRRHAVGRDRLRRGARSALRRHGQR